MIGHPYSQQDSRALLRLQNVIKPLILRRTKDMIFDGEPILRLPNRTEKLLLLSFRSFLARYILFHILIFLVRKKRIFINLFIVGLRHKLPDLLKVVRTVN